MEFVQEINQDSDVARTTNGMRAHSNTGSALVDLFFKIGASRGKSVVAEFDLAMQEDQDLAVKIALWSRDVRGGAGEREIFRDILLHLENIRPDVLEKVLPFVPEFGRWDDVLIFRTEKFKNLAYTLLGQALANANGLAAKWTPRKGPVAVEFREFLKMSPKQYRKFLVGLTNVVETKMCAKQWDTIEFGKLPSLASARYSKAFARNAAESYAAYRERLTAGTDKINTGAVYPYDVIRTIQNGGDSAVADAQWSALPDYIGNASILPLVDVSGSMASEAAGSLTALDVAVSLGLYCSSKNTGVFRDTFLTFSSHPELVRLSGTLSEKLAQMNSSEWGMSTNLVLAFEKILEAAVLGSVPEENMPQTLLILSDMQFDRCVNFDHSAYQMIKNRYQSAGYRVPNVVFWNLASISTVPVRFDQRGTALVSGFSPAIMRSVLSAADLTPYGIMLATVDTPRYSVL